MLSAPRLFLIALLASATALGLYTWREHTLATRRQAFSEKMAATRAAIDRLQHERATAEAERAELSRQAVEPAAARAPAPPPSPAVTAWERNVALLRTLLTQHPQWSIPEIALLSPEEFIFFAREAPLDDEDAQRRTLRDLRGLAKRKLASEFHRALDRYAQAHDGGLPTDLSELRDLFQTPIPDAVLKRYALTGVPLVPANRLGEPLIYERAPVDELYDTRHVLGVATSTQFETNPAIYVLSRALLAYANANSGRQPSQPSDLSTYLEAPLDPPTLARYFETWRTEPATLGLRRAKSVMMFRPLGSAPTSPN